MGNFIVDNLEPINVGLTEDEIHIIIEYLLSAVFRTDRVDSNVNIIYPQKDTVRGKLYFKLMDILEKKEK